MNNTNIEFIKFLKKYKEKELGIQYSVKDNTHKIEINESLFQIFHKNDNIQYFNLREMCPNVELQKIIAERFIIDKFIK